jgi:hypothetical protein
MRKATANKGLAIAGVLPMKNRDRQCFADSFVVKESAVLRVKFSAKTIIISNERTFDNYSADFNNDSFWADNF